MTVELNFTGNASDVSPSDKQALFADIDYNVHIGLSLKDTDDEDYPDVKQDLAETVADLSVDFGTVDEVTERLYGEMQ